MEKKNNFGIVSIQKQNKTDIELVLPKSLWNAHFSL